ncbi:MAG TPA: HNH endonuclease [Tepidisphaeraceae bacterium]|jgi:hypothetical protein
MNIDDGSESGRGAWVIRANPHHIARMDVFLRRGIVALGWPKLGSLAGQDLDDIRATLRRKYGIRDRSKLGHSAGALDALVNRVGPGDLALVPSPEDGAVYLAEFYGGYRYSPRDEPDCFPHQRRVTWLLDKERIPRFLLPPALVRSLRAHQPIFATDFKAVVGLITSHRGHAAPRATTGTEADTDGTLVALEGDRVAATVMQSKRDRRLREAKIRLARRAAGGRLVCEVPGCGFDFERVYGVLGSGFAHVHHRESLSSRRGRRRHTSIDELAIVCANCHAMIHRHGACRRLDELIPAATQTFMGEPAPTVQPRPGRKGSG